MTHQNNPVLDVSTSELLERLEFLIDKSKNARLHAKLSSQHFLVTLQLNDSLWDYLRQSNQLAEIHLDSKLKSA